MNILGSASANSGPGVLGAVVPSQTTGFGQGVGAGTLGGVGSGSATGGFGAGMQRVGGFGTSTNASAPTGFGAAANTTGAPTGFGAAANTTGAPTGFGAAANTTGAPTGFGAAANTTGAPTGFGAAANTTGAPTGFGAAANTTGAPTGFGAAANTTGAPTGFGAAANTTGAPTGFGAAANTTGAPTGFGAAANTTGAPTGFGAAANTTGAPTGFGAAANTTGAPTGFGAAANTTGALTGFGNTANPVGGFGGANFASSSTTGLASGAQSVATGVPQHQIVNCQSAVGRYLMELDHAYNALHPNCRFRCFLYNVCAPGQSIMAAERERLIYVAAGGESKGDEVLQAQQRNPDPVRLYPTRVHFMQELKNRVDKQKEILEAMSKHVDSLIIKAEQFRELDEANAALYRELQQEQAMLQRRWCSLLMKVETIRQLGLPLAEESRMGGIVSTLSAQLSAPGVYKTALAELQPFLDNEAAGVVSFLRERSANELEDGLCIRSARKGALLSNRVDQTVLRDWARFAERIQHGVESLTELLESDTADMRAIRQRVTSC